ncbi:TRAP transporter small permease [Pseudohalocynthiibacter aestuariivivens]|nr:TRAP transporter small permease [Pseudohalocynthiibacter aestuariivivens]QIE45997.1 TRAP transporter small permease [Pseudohalocynthiibacter aestuariivivens]
MIKLSNFMAALAGIIMLLMVGHILLEIFLRSFLYSSTYVLDEFVGYGTAAMTFLALPRAAITNNLIRVSLIETVVQRSRPRKILDLFTTAATFAICGGLTYYIGLSAMRNFSRGRVSETIAEVPLWIPEAVVLVGLAAFLLLLAVRFVALVTNGQIRLK